MTDSEKWAWWTLGAVGLTAAYFSFVAFLGDGPATQAVFALLALIAIPATSRRHLQGRKLDEREREISNTALLAGLRVLWLVFILLVLGFGFLKGDTSVTLPLWALTQTLWGASILVLTVAATTTLILYRRGQHA
jgi:hypothetical protein